MNIQSNSIVRKFHLYKYSQNQKFGDIVKDKPVGKYKIEGTKEKGLGENVDIYI